MYYGAPDCGEIAPLDGPIVVVQYSDEFVRTEAGWRFASRRPKVIFRHAAFADMVHTKADELRWAGRA
jgi:hypothetical protein